MTASLLTMLAYTARLQRERVDPVAIGASWTERNAIMLETCQRDRDVIPAARSMDVVFHEFMADDLTMLERIYAVADRPLDDRARRAHTGYLAHHLRDRHGKVFYEFEQFGIDPREVRERFEPYVERFGVRREWEV